MIQAIYNDEQVLSSNTDTVDFNAVDLRTNSAQCFNGWLNYNIGSSQFNILAGGIYEVSFNANVTSAEIGNVALALFTDGVELAGTEMDASVSTAGMWRNISFVKRFRVCPRGNVTLTINSVPTTAYSGTSTATQIQTLKNVNITISRVNG